jgi:hypothetical protein
VNRAEKAHGASRKPGKLVVAKPSQITENRNTPWVESQVSIFQPEFNRSVQVEARPERLTADAGALLLRQLMDSSGVSELLAEHLVDARNPLLVEHGFLELLRTLLLLPAQGWRDQLDVTLLREDPVLRLAVSERRGAGVLAERPGLCSQPTLSRLLHALAAPCNREGLGTVLLESAARRKRLRHGSKPLDEATLDVDSLAQEVHGYQPGSGYNGHYGVQCYHPVLVSWDQGDFLAARLRPGNVHTAEGGLDFVLPVLRWAKLQARTVWVRMDAGFPGAALLSGLEAEGCRYVARMKTNRKLEQLAAPLLKRPVGRPPAAPRTWLHELSYQAASWSAARRVVLVMVERSGELFPDHFFLVTNAPVEETCAEELLVRYRYRGLAEKDFGDWQTAFDPHLSSSPRPKRHYRGQRLPERESVTDSFGANEALLLMNLLSANLVQHAASLVHRATHQRWSRSRFRQLVLKTAGRVVLGKRYITVVIDARGAHLWQSVAHELTRLARGSPSHDPLPA